MICVFNAHSSSFLQLLAVFMQMGARELLMHYMDLKQTNDVQLTFEALKVNTVSPSLPSMVAKHEVKLF